MTMAQSVFDPNYEFNAPRFYDFSQVENSGEGDSFFEKDGVVLQPSPEKPIKGKKKTDDVVPKEQVPPVDPPVSKGKGTVLSKAMRALRLTNGEKNPLFKKPDVPKQKLAVVPIGPGRLPSPTVGVKKCKPQSPTKPKGFAFHTDERALLPRKRELFSGSSSRSGQTSAYGSSTSINTAVKPIGAHGSAAVPPKATIAKSASQENVQGGFRRKTTCGPPMLLSRRSASAGQLAEKQVPLFKARPAPPAAVSGMPSKHIKPVTQPQPFRFQTDKVLAQHKEKPCLKKDEELRRKTVFHARPMPDFSRPAFATRVGEKHVTAPEPLLLNTERRAEKRKAFDEILKKREEEVKEEMAQRENEKRRLEEEEIRQLRRTLVHHPLPVKMNKPMEVKRGVIAPTKPETPKFLIEQRLKQRSLRPQNNESNGKM